MWFFGDNSLAVFSLPSLNIIELVSRSSWLSRHAGDVLTIFVDEPAENGFVYVGTTAGLLLVLECTAAGPLRVCDYAFTWSDAGLTKCMALASIQTSPKVCEITLFDMCGTVNTILLRRFLESFHFLYHSTELFISFLKGFSKFMHLLLYSFR